MRIFYSWQSDLPSKSNHELIHEALLEAGERLRGDISLQVEPVIERDATGEAGSPDIAGTIFQRIDTGDTFVADVSIITPADHHRPAPNPNVLIELGYAISRLGWDRVLLVMNTEYGPPETLPFDLRGRRVVKYRPGDKPKAARTNLAVRLERELRIILDLIARPSHVDQLLETVRSSQKSDWSYDDPAGQFVFKKDVDLRIQDRRDPSSREPFKEEWANRHPDPSARREWYDIYYRSSLIHSFMLVSVDGGRAELPLPNIGTNVIPNADYRLARVVDTSGRLDEYISRSGLGVSEQ